MRSNKWNISWQVARVRAKKIKDVQERVEFMQEWLNQHNHYENVDRIKNWYRMCIMSSGGDRRAVYQKAYDQLADYVRTHEFIKEDMRDELDDFEKWQLRDVLNDVDARRYDFQYRGKQPPGHKQFVQRLENVLS